MPRVNLYVREDDYEAYEAIVDKPRWLHRAIHDTPAQRLPLNVIRGTEKKKEPATRATPTKVNTPKIPGLAKSENIKQNSDGTLSPAIIGKPSSFTTDVQKFPPSAASQVIKTPEEAKKIVESPKFIDKGYSARKKGSKERHVDL